MVGKPTPAHTERNGIARVHEQSGLVQWSSTSFCSRPNHINNVKLTDNSACQSQCTQLRVQMTAAAAHFAVTATALFRNLSRRTNFLQPEFVS